MDTLRQWMLCRHACSFTLGVVCTVMADWIQVISCQELIRVQTCRLVLVMSVRLSDVAVIVHINMHACVCQSYRTVGLYRFCVQASSSCAVYVCACSDDRFGYGAALGYVARAQYSLRTSSDLERDTLARCRIASLGRAVARAMRRAPRLGVRPFDVRWRCCMRTEYGRVGCNESTL